MVNNFFLQRNMAWNRFGMFFFFDSLEPVKSNQFGNLQSVESPKLFFFNVTLHNFEIYKHENEELFIYFQFSERYE